MAARDALSRFVREALAAGRTREEVRAALTSAGWSEREIGACLSAYADTDFVPPVPRPVPYVTARDVFVYALLFTALTLTASYLIVLVNSVLDILLPDAGDGEWRGDYAEGSIRWAISVLVVSAPLYAWLTIHTGRKIARDTGERRSLVRRWLTFIALFVTALAFLGDISYVIYSFLSGEVTLRFLLKALTVALVAGGIFAFYLADLREPDRVA